MRDADFSALTGLELTAYQTIVTADADFEALALEEVAHMDPQATSRRLAPGVFSVDGSRSFGDLAEAWLVKPPIFVRHLCPVQVTVTLDAAAPDLAALDAAVAMEIAPYLADGATFSVQTRILGGGDLKPFDINQRLAALISEVSGQTLDVRNPAQVVSVVIVAEAPGTAAVPRVTVFLGASVVTHNLSDWAGGVRRFAREEGQISRSEFKLLEALEVFRLELPPRGSALDLGAAPGGWTRILRAQEQYVTAVDPAELDARLADDRGIRVKRMTAEAYLATEPDRFDVIVNDMRMDGRDSARLMVAYAGCLYAHGWALMTLKLPEAKRRPVIDQTFAILRQAYEIVGARQLFHNRSEITVCLRPRPRSEED